VRILNVCVNIENSDSKIVSSLHSKSEEKWCGGREQTVDIRKLHRPWKKERGLEKREREGR
jgi:hypothetical protein